MFCLVYANQLEALARCFGVSIASCSSERAWLESHVLIVPHEAIGEHVKQVLVRLHGIASCLTIVTPLAWVDHLARASKTYSLLSRCELEGLLLELFLDISEPAHSLVQQRRNAQILRESAWNAPDVREHQITENFPISFSWAERMNRLSDDPSLEPVRAYLHAAGHDPSALARRYVSLAKEVAQRFMEYDLYRPDMLSAWDRGDACEEMHAWQKTLWLALFGKHGLATWQAKQTGIRKGLLSSLIQQGIFQTCPVPPMLHVFGFSWFARAFQHMFDMLAKRCTLWMYVPNPSREFWGDLDPSFKEHTQEDRKHDRSADPLALRTWGEVWQKHIRWIEEQSQGDHLDAFVDPWPKEERAPVLQQLQQQIFVCAQSSMQPDAKEAATLLVLDCPNKRREMEAIAETIGALIGSRKGEKPLFLPEDIAVVLAGKDLAQSISMLRAVFEEWGLSYVLMQAPLTRENRMLDAVWRLITLPGSECTRQDLLSLLTHPLARGDISDADKLQWANRCHALGVVREAHDIPPEESYLESKPYNWDQALSRLVLGLFMSDDSPAFFCLEGNMLPYNTHLEDMDSLGQFVLRVRSLLADIAYARNTKQSMADWSLFFHTLITTYIEPKSARDQSTWNLCREALYTLDTLALTTPVSYALAATYAEAALSRIHTTHGAGGIAVYPLLPMRTVPARILFLAGLSEGEFPAPDRREAWNLRDINRPSWDPNPSAHDRLAFLETLLAARERIYFSYVRHDAGASAFPLPLILRELDNILTNYGTHPEAGLIRRVVSPIRSSALSSSGSPVLCAHPEAEKEELARAMHADLHNVSQPPLSWPILHKALPSSRLLLEPLRLPALWLDHSIPPHASPVQLSFSALRHFLRCPLQGYARAILGIRTDTDHDKSMHEPIAFPYGGIHMLRCAFWRALETEQDLHHAYAEEVKQLARTIPLPTGFFAEIQNTLHSETLRLWQQLTQEVLPTTRSAPLWFGRAPEESSVSCLHPFLSLSLPRPEHPPLHILLHGRIEAIFSPDQSTCLRLLHRSGTLQTPHDLLHGFLDHILLSATGLLSGPSTFFLANAATKRATKWIWHPCSQEKAHTYLLHLLEDLLLTPSFSFFPGEAAFLYRKRPEQPLSTAIDSLRTHSRNNPDITSLFQAYPSPSPEEAAALFERRYALLFTLLADTTRPNT